MLSSRRAIHCKLSCKIVLWVYSNNAYLVTKNVYLMLTYAILDVLKPTKNNALYKLLPRYGHGRPTSLRRSGDGYCRYFISFSKERRFSNSFILLLQLIHKGVKNWIGLSWYVTFSAFLQTAYANKQSFPFPQTQVKWRQATNDLGCVSCLLN